MILTNTVPYKPPGNKAYSTTVKNRFRPFIEQLLVFHWQGRQIITLGTEAFKWYEPYGQTKDEVSDYFKKPDRFEQSLTVTLSAQDSQGITQQKQVSLLPLPHPSPLNKRYYSKFPAMLKLRMEQVLF